MGRLNKGDVIDRAGLPATEPRASSVLATMRHKLSYSNVMATIAVFLGLGGGAYAATSSLVNARGAIHGCVSMRNGSLSVVNVGKHCPRGMASVVFDAQGHVGPRGARGVPGTPGAAGLPGTPGPAGAPGSALAYAHVLADGTIDTANSKGVTAASLDTAGGTSDYYCLTVTGTIHTAVVTAGSAPTIAGAEGTYAFVDLTNFGTCPAGTNLRVGLERKDGTNLAVYPFYVTIN